MQNADLPAALVAPVLPKVDRPRLHDTVVDHLRNFIVEGLLAPGVKLNERKLCETLGISRTPLREALKVLAAEGLVDILPNRGASISQMSEAEIRETFELMSGLEAFSGELACERMTPAELAEIKALHYAMLGCRARFRSNFQTPKWDSAIRDHEAMIEALDARDGKRMAAILRAHLLAKRDAVLAERTLTTVRGDE
jgi:DNA-binding GntR family transcriptional regulator